MNNFLGQIEDKLNSGLRSSGGVDKILLEEVPLKQAKQCSCGYPVKELPAGSVLGLNPPIYYTNCPRCKSTLGINPKLVTKKNPLMKKKAT